MNGMTGDAGRRRGGRRAPLVLGLALAGSLLFSAASAASCRAQSGPGQAALIEAAEPTLSGKVVPLALHVDYWDSLGWRDRFAQPSFSARQRALTAVQGSKTVFTPQVMINGRTTLNWSRNTAFRQHIAAINTRPAEAELSLEIVPAPDAWLVQVRGRLQPRLAAARAGVFVALYQDGLTSQVTAGENATRRLRHERVTRELIGPLPVAADGTFAHPHRFRPPEDARSRDLGVAAFVQDQTDGQVWQALALAACPE